MIYNLVLNSTNVIDSINKTQYAYTFINGNFYIPENSKMCISQCMIPYSWFNINSTLYNNNSFSYVWYYGNGLSKTYTVTIPNGFYSISDIQQYLEVYMISQNQYFTNTITGQNLYYIYLSSNSTYYSIQLIRNALPSSLPSSYAAPTNGFNYKNEIWFVGHLVSYEQPRHYYHIFMVFDENMKLLRYSAPFKFDEHCIEYCLGLIVEDDRVICSYSTWDRTSIIALYDKKIIDDKISYNF